MFLWIVIILTSAATILVNVALFKSLSYGVGILDLAILYAVIFLIFKFDAKQSLQICGVLLALMVLSLLLIGAIFYFIVMF
jgi:hypothetical protein